MFIGLFSTTGGWPESRPATARLREHLTHLGLAITQVERMLRMLHTYPRQRLNERLFIIDRFFSRGIINHFHAEERSLAPLISEMHQGEVPFSAVWQPELARMHERIIELHRLIDGSTLFLPKIQEVGLDVVQRVKAHFAEEEAILFPFLDARMTEEEIEEKLADLLVDHGEEIVPTGRQKTSYETEGFYKPK